MKFALVIGHTEHNGGAGNIKRKVNEFQFNKKLVIAIEEELRNESNVRCEIVYRESYKYLPNKINSLDPDAIICFHCNAWDTEVSGSETLYYYKSMKGKYMSQLFQGKVVSCLNLRNRGIKGKRVSGRGGYILRYTDAACVILEPFFIDNDNDLKVANEKFDELVMAIVDGIKIMASK